MNSDQRINPFKGLYNYEEADKDMFFGRDNLSRDLFNLVALNALTLVFGKSGIGKTSLLNAGLFPLLRDADFLPVRLRMDYSSSGAPLIDQVKKEIQKQLRENGVIERVKGGSEPTHSFSEGETLWEYFHRVDHVNEDGKIVTPILVFDQFEEIFTIGKHHPQRDLLIEELNDLVEDQVPVAVKERLLSRAGVFPYLRSQIAVRIVFGLREDYLPHMNALKPRIPSIHRVMSRVIHLNGIQAHEVLDRTGAFSNERIKQDILHQFEPVDLEPGQTVALEKLEVEPALLSLLCYQAFEQKVESLSVRAKDAILSGFYDRVLAQLPRGDDLSTWIEDHLLTEKGFRTPFYMDRSFVLRETVEEAINKKLLRKLSVEEKEYVEIIHDVLAPVIKERRDRRLEDAKKKRLEIEKELQRKRMITGIISVACIIAITLAIFAFIQKNRADVQYRSAFSLRLFSESSFAFALDNVKAIRLAEAAYKMGSPNPAPAVIRALSEAAYSTRKRPFYTVSFNHKNKVNTAIFSTDGGRILTASDDNNAKLWDLKGNLLADFKGHTDDVKSAVFSPDGQQIITASADKIAKLWNLKGNLLADFKGHKNEVTRVVFSPDGRWILTASLDNTAKLWDLNGKLLADFIGHSSYVYSAVFSLDGQRILTASADNTAKLWDLDGRLLADLKGHTDGVTGAVFSPYGERILTASLDNTAKLWDLKGNLLAEFKGHTNSVTSAVFSPNGKWILAASLDNTAKLWDLNGKLLADFIGHSSYVNSAVFSPDGQRILTASTDKTAKLWDLNGKLLADFIGHSSYVYSAVFSTDGRRILTASEDQTAKLWDLKGNLLTDFKGHMADVYSAVFSPDGGQILTASWDNTAKLWDLQGNLLADFKGHTDTVFSAVFSPDGKQILTASDDNTAKLWDLQGNLLADFKGHTGPIYNAVFSPDGEWILTASEDKTAKLWDLKGNLLAELKGHTSDVYRAVFSPDGKKILTTSDDTTGKLWDLKGNLLAELKGHTSGVYSAVFSPDGKKILTTSDDTTAKLWNLKGNLLAELKGHTSGVYSAVFSTDGRRILTASEDQTAKLWDLKGNLLADFKGHTAPINSAVFSPDGKKIVTASRDGTAIIWPTPEGIMDWLKTAPIPKLTQEEKKELGIADFDL